MGFQQFRDLLKKCGITRYIHSYYDELPFEFHRAIKNNDPFTIKEHYALFDFFWEEGNKKRNTNTPISDALKLNIIRNRHDIFRYDLAITGDFRHQVIDDVIAKCHLRGRDEAEMWSIFQKNYPELCTRDSDSINQRLNMKLYDVVRHKLKWFGRINVLDIGCGVNGTSITTLQVKYHGKINGFGVDLNISEHSSSVTLLRANAEHLPFKDNYFDVVYSSDVMYYINDAGLENALKEVLRVLRPKGYFIFDDHARANRKGFYEGILAKSGFRARILRREPMLIFKDR